MNLLKDDNMEIYTDKRHCFPLHKAIANGKLLLLFHFMNKYVLTCIQLNHFQSTGDLEKILKILKLNEVDINEEDNDGNNALQLAIQNGSFCFVSKSNYYFQEE